MQFLIEIEEHRSDRSAEFLRGELEAFTSRLAAFYARPAVPRVTVLQLGDDHAVVPVSALIRLQEKAAWPGDPNGEEFRIEALKGNGQ